MSACSSPIIVLAGGSGGIHELRRRLDDRTVSWALLRFQVGSGAFLRTKLVSVHCSGEDMPVGRRGLLNSRGSEVLGLLGKAHAHIEITSSRELTADYLSQRLLPLFTADNLDLSPQDMAQEFARMEAEALARRRAKAKLERRLTPTEALRAVGADRGAYNWALLEASTLALHGAGYGGISELKAELSEDSVLFGLLRLSFGRATNKGDQAGPGITKHVLIHWVGPSVSAVRRGIWNARLHEAVALIGEWCAVTLRWEAHNTEQIDLEDIIAELRRLTVVDTAVADRIVSKEYFASLEEDVREHELEVDEWDCDVATETDLGKATSMVRSSSGEWNWVLCGCEPPRRLSSSARPATGGS